MTYKYWLSLLALLLLMGGCTQAVRLRSAPVTDNPDIAALPTQNESAAMDLYKPVTGDVSMQRDGVNIDSLAILASDSYPPQYRLEVRGTLPSPCHELRAVTDVPPMENRIKVQVYSVYDPYNACSQVLKPFDASIPLGGYIRGSYPVFVNGGEIGEITP